MINDLLLFAYFSLIMFLIDIQRNQCILSKTYNTPMIYILLYLHQFVSLFVTFGFLVEDRTLLLIYLLSPILVITHWKTNNNKCYLTELANHICDDDDNLEFFDIMSLIGLKKDKYYYILFGVGWTIGLLKYLRIINFNWIQIFSRD